MIERKAKNRGGKIHARRGKARTSVEASRRKVRRLQTLPSAASVSGRTVSDLPDGLVHPVRSELGVYFFTRSEKPGEHKMDKAFEVHRLNSRGIQKAQRLAGIFDTNLAIIREIVGETNLLNHSKMELCVEHLELASFYAKKAIAMQFENQEGAGDGKDVAFVAQPQCGTEAPSPLNELWHVKTIDLETELKRRYADAGTRSEASIGRANRDRR
jgi:hypothetical protein